MNVRAAYHHVSVALRKARSVVVCGHVRPDGDSVGSALALTLALRDAGIAAVPTLADAGVPAPVTYAFLPGYGLYAQAGDLDAPDVFVVLDTPKPDRLGAALELAEKAGTVCVIDHHGDAEEWGDINAIDATSAAVGGMIWHLLESLDITPSADVALCCYVAMLTDTGRFQYDNTTATTMRDAADMIDAGADPAEASRLVYQSRRPEALALEARAMSRLTVANKGHVAFSWIDSSDFDETGALRSEAELLPDAVRSLGGIDVAVFFRINPEEVRVGLRAKTGFDVAEVAHEFGGGGHRAAAGFTWRGSMADLQPRLLALLPGGAT